MKRKSIRAIAGLAVVNLIFLIGLNSSVKAGQYDEIYGWAWSENIGWLSLNCFNQGGAGCAPDYGLDYDNHSLSGAAWSEFGGWVCFGQTCNQAGWQSLTAPDGAAAEIVVQPTGLLNGWARYEVLGENGWLKLLGEPEPASPVVRDFPWCKNCADAVCAICFESAANQGSGRICQMCDNCSPDGPEDYNCTSCVNCYDYGAAIDFEKNTIMGWAWNGDSLNHGFGWLQFQPGQAPPVLTNLPYIKTKHGDIYAEQGIGSLQTPSPPAGQFSGTFMLQTSDVNHVAHFSSCMDETGGLADECLGLGEQNSAGWVNREVDLDFPDQASNYKNQFGGFDLKGLFAGQYGPVRTIIGAGQIQTAPLAGVVYFVDGDLTINSAMTFYNALGAQSGAGTVIVRGNLTIQSNLNYALGNAAGLVNLASAGFIVIDDGTGNAGNIYIDPAVTELAGNFYAENRITTVAGDLPLAVKGLMIAERFEFNRQYTDLETRAPSEEIIYDGRVIANPPPGFAALASYLPVWLAD